MNLFKIILKNMRQRALATCLTIFSVLLGVALTVTILLLKKGAEERFQQNTIGYQMVVGAKGSPLQLVLNTVYNLDLSPGNIPWTLFEQLRADRRVKFAVPFSVGDNYQGFRILGTTDALFKDFEFKPGRKLEMAQGRAFNFSEASLKEAFEEAEARAKAEREGVAAPKHEEHDHDHEHEHAVFEAVIGSTVAKETRLKIGDKFRATHGLVKEAEGEEHDDQWTVVGVLQKTETANDRAIFINLDSFYHIEGHEQGGVKLQTKETPKNEDENEPSHGQISSIVLKTRSDMLAPMLQWEINRSEIAMAAVPAEQIRKLFDIVGKIDRVLMAQAILIIIVAGVGITVSIYNSMSERRREIAILRALGAKRGTIFSIVVLEAVMICVAGGVAGLLGGHLLVAAASPILEQASGFTVSAFEFQKIELWVLVGCVVLGALSGFGPAARAYRTDVASNLAPTS